MLLPPTTPTNAPGTTIQVANASLRATVDIDRGTVNVSVRLLDSSGNGINPPQPIRQMNSSEVSTFLAMTATAGETTSQFLARAALPYITSAYGIVYATV